MIAYFIIKIAIFWPGKISEDFKSEINYDRLDFLLLLEPSSHWVPAYPWPIPFQAVGSNHFLNPFLLFLFISSSPLNI